MSRYCGNNNAAFALQAAEHWKENALLLDGSVFSDENLWTSKSLNELSNSIARDLDEGDGGYWAKLRNQLERGNSAMYHLSAELNWLMLLCPSNIGTESKSREIRQLWEAGGSPTPKSADKWLSTEMLEGVGSAGTAYNNHRWRELNYAISIFSEFKKLSLQDRQSLVTDAWRFADWLSLQPDSDRRQFRHMLLFLLFPDSFERIFGGSDREKIVKALGDTHGKTFSHLSNVDVDRVLSSIREKYEQQFGTKNLDFYVSPLREEWGAGHFTETTQSLTRAHVLKALDKIDQNGIPAGAESTKYDLVYESRRYPPKLVLQLSARIATGSDLSRDQFKGGEESGTFKALRNLGFQIEAKRFIADLVERFIKQADERTSQSTSGYPSSYRGLEIKLSFGFGNFAAVPWISFLGKGQVTSKGIYPVLLYYREQRVLILAYGVSDTQTPELHWGSLPADTQTIYEYFDTTHGKKPERYGESWVAIATPTSPKVDASAITETLDRMIDTYIHIVEPSAPASSQQVLKTIPYTIDDALQELFIPKPRLEEMVRRLGQKKNLILQGPPGVGKTYVAKRLAYLMMGEKDPVRLGMVQFHQAYAYEDFIQGYRPDGTGFRKKNGVFHEFCDKARADRDRAYVFIIDEINRANLSKVFGELMMLIESDKRGEDWAVPLTYAESEAETFYVPPNVFIIGLMNTADRSLAMVDYALRRRFAFLDVEPGFDTQQYKTSMLAKGTDESLIERICSDMEALNSAIAKDTANLGKGFRIGHSYFCPDHDAGTVPDVDWYREVIKSEISPLLEEYWFDDPDQHGDWLRRLMQE